MKPWCFAEKKKQKLVKCNSFFLDPDDQWVVGFSLYKGAQEAIHPNPEQGPNASTQQPFPVLSQPLPIRISCAAQVTSYVAGTVLGATEKMCSLHQ